MTWIASATGRTQQENIDAGQTRLEQVSPAAYKAMAGLEGFVRASASTQRCSIW